MTRKILNKPIGKDEHGDIYFCRYSKQNVSFKDSIFIGAILPQVSGSFVCHPDGLKFFKEEKEVFNEFDANCNTCKNLERIPFKKQHAANPMTANCKLKKISIIFHPDDHMGMDCWEKRC